MKLNVRVLLYLVFGGEIMSDFLFCKSENICTQLHFACMLLTEIPKAKKDRSVIVL